jgi:probable rRNA maturation factor
MSAAAALSLSVQYASARECPSRAQLRRWASAALAEGYAERQSRRNPRFHLVLRFVERAEARRLNREFRARDYATNVLTFPYDDGVPAGDVILCCPVIEIEARRARLTTHEHYAHLVIHGVLHALGFDHLLAREAAQMEGLEVRTLARFRIDDPYQT